MEIPARGWIPRIAKNFIGVDVELRKVVFAEKLLVGLSETLLRFWLATLEVLDSDQHGNRLSSPGQLNPSASFSLVYHAGEMVPGFRD